MKHEKFVREIQKEQNDFITWLSHQPNIDWTFDGEKIIVSTKGREEDGET